VEAVVVILGANLIVVGNRLGITTGEDLAEAAVGNATENVSPGGVKENVLCIVLAVNLEETKILSPK